MGSMIKIENFEDKLVDINSTPVLLAKDVADLYEVEVKYLNRMAEKYKHLFPDDYRFQLTDEQWANLKCIENTSVQRIMVEQGIILMFIRKKVFIC